MSEYREFVCSDGVRWGQLAINEALVKFNLSLNDIDELIINYEDCGTVNGTFLFNTRIYEGLLLWRKVGSAYQEMGIYHFLTTMDLI